MILRLALMTGAALAVLVTPVLAQDPAPQEGSGGPDSVSLTIYNQNIALVEDTRSLTISAGRSRREFPGVSASIRPETVGCGCQPIACRPTSAMSPATPRLRWRRCSSADSSRPAR